jgi:uncharacterized damage-inducible protein DinB
MIKILTEYLDRLQALHIEIQQALDGLPLEALDWKPGPKMNSIGVLVTHLTGAERYWVGDVAGQDPSGRVRQTEFQAHGADQADLQRHLSNSLNYIRKVLSNPSLEDLDALRLSLSDGQRYTVAWCLLHALEHSAIHLGHIQLTRQLWEGQAEKNT